MNTRMMWTYGLWTAFIGAVVLNHYFIFDQGAGVALDFLMLILFGRFMWIRMDKLDNPAKPLKCCLGLHDNKETFSGQVMVGTGQYINGDEIQKKRWRTEWHCQRPGCDHWDRIGG